jgi:caffeoyl-CoA O-methyltransferase
MAGAILNKKVEKYLEGLIPRRDAVLAEMERRAKRHNIPIIGPMCGRLLHLMTRLSGAERIFEMGSAIGYSTIWLARAAGEGAEVFYTDGSAANAETARGYIEKAGMQDRIKILVGNALELLDQVPGNFDLIFIDVDKHWYPESLKKAVPRLRTGGLIITDNTLWSGKVTKKAAAKDADTQGVQEFNRLTYTAKDLFPIIVPLRDGVTVCQKI